MILREACTPIQKWVFTKPVWAFIVTGILAAVLSFFPLVFLCEFCVPSGRSLGTLGAPILYVIALLPLVGLFVGWAIAMIGVIRIAHSRKQRREAAALKP
jgi:hypothetical protein